MKHNISTSKYRHISRHVLVTFSLSNICAQMHALLWTSLVPLGPALGLSALRFHFTPRFPLASKSFCRIQKLISKWLFLQSTVCWIHITKWSNVPTHLLLPWEAVLSQLSYAYPAGSFHWKGIRFSLLKHVNTWFLQIFTAVHFYIDFFISFNSPTTIKRPKDRHRMPLFKSFNHIIGWKFVRRWKAAIRSKSVHVRSQNSMEQYEIHTLQKPFTFYLLTIYNHITA